MKKLTFLLSFLFFACLSEVAGASMLSDDTILVDVNLTTSSGNSLIIGGNVFPGADAICFFTDTVGCPPGTLWDGGALNGPNPGWDLGIWVDVQETGIAILFIDNIGEAGETISGTVTYSDIGWGSMEGVITGGNTCGLSTIAPGLSATCDEPLGAFAVFSDNAVTLTIDAYELIPSNSSFAGGQGVEFDVDHVVPLPAAAWLFGSALLGLCMIKRKNV